MQAEYVLQRNLEKVSPQVQLKIKCWEMIGRYETLTQHEEEIERDLAELRRTDSSVPGIAAIYMDWLDRAKPVLEQATASLGEKNAAVTRLFDFYERCLDAVNQISWGEAGRRVFGSETPTE